MQNCLKSLTHQCFISDDYCVLCLYYQRYAHSFQSSVAISHTYIINTEKWIMCTKDIKDMLRYKTELCSDQEKRFKRKLSYFYKEDFS